MSIRLMLLMMMFGYAAQAQVNQYFVYFKDKTGTPYSVSQPDQFLSPKSLTRRTKQGITVKEEDLPVNPAYVQLVKTTGAETFFTSRWWNGVLVECDETTLAQVNTLACVKESILVAPGSRLSDGRVGKVSRRKETQEDVNHFQLQQLGIDQMHMDGFRGEGMAIAVFDSGFEGVSTTAPFANLFSENRVKYTFNYVTNSPSVYELDDHGTEVLSVMAAYVSGTYTGGAYKADYYLFLTEDWPTEFRIEEFNWTFAAERADSLGVDIINSSLGYNTFDDVSMDYQIDDLNGSTAIVTQAARKAIEKGMLVVCSAGNEGSTSWKFVTPPADAIGILAVGSVTSSGSRSTFSSIGPTADARIKPDVVALGSGTQVIRSNGNVGTSSGTSVASPLIASLAAGIWQAYPILTAQEVYNLIIGTASHAINPNNQLGYGIPHYEAVINNVEAPKPEEVISVFPNPTSETLKILISELTAEPITVEIYDVKGSRVMNQQQTVIWQNNPLEIELGHLAAGLYAVVVKSGNHSTQVRILKQ